MSQTQTQTILEKISMVSFDGRAITGLTSTDDGDRNVFTSRAVRYLSTKVVNPFTALRAGCQSKLLRLGTRFLGGYAIPQALEAEAREILHNTNVEWSALRSDLLNKFDSHVSDWIAANPEVKPFEHTFPNAAWVEKRIGFESCVYQIQAVNAPGDSMDQLLGGLPTQVISEISTDVRQSWDPESKRMNAKTRGVITRITSKLEGLAFLGGDLGRMAKKLREVLSMLPYEGSFNPAEQAIAGVVLGMLCTERGAMDLLNMDPASIVVPTASNESTENFDFSGLETQTEPTQTPLVEPVMSSTESEAIVNDIIAQAKAASIALVLPDVQTQATPVTDDNYELSF